MKTNSEKIPNPKELEKELGEFLSKKFGGNVKVSTPIIVPQETFFNKAKGAPKKSKGLKFNLKPEELVSYLDQYIIKQDDAKTVLATKICTHFNRIKYFLNSSSQMPEMVGRIKNNVLMVGPTGVGKTYMIRLIAQKIGVPFVKGDATKFSETGYVGNDVEDLVRDLVREAEGDIERAQYGIIYIDEIDKIASSSNLIGADISRTGVQRALLKPLEETEVDLKVPHDPISIMQELENFRKTGKRDKKTINTKNILFIMSGAFGDLSRIISERVLHQGIGFGTQIIKSDQQDDVLKMLKSEDLINFGFESEFVGRLPVRAIFERLTEDDLYTILKNPNNPIILGKKLDFGAYYIKAKFEDQALKLLSHRAFEENTGARGLVSSIEHALLLFEKKLPSTSLKKFPITSDIIENPFASLEWLIDPANQNKIDKTFQTLFNDEKAAIIEYIYANKKNLNKKHGLSLTAGRIDLIARFYSEKESDIENIFKQVKICYEDIKSIELNFLKEYGINVVLEEEAIDLVIEQYIKSSIQIDDFYIKFIADFELGLKLVREKTGRNRFFITKQGLLSPDKFISRLLTNNCNSPGQIKQDDMPKKEI